MIKKLPYLLAILLVLSGCGGPKISKNSGLLSLKEQAEKKSGEETKRPRIPEFNELKASLLEAKKPSETEELLKEIEKRIDQPNIVYEDIERGWYYGGINDKKLGTPSTWVWANEGKKSRWVSPNALSEKEEIEAEALCKNTAGTYVLSCLETEEADCEVIPKSFCRCIEGSTWNEKEGCIFVDNEGEWVKITEEELKQGWYQGLPNQKKLNTPLNWVWVDAGQNSRWQNQNPLN